MYPFYRKYYKLHYSKGDSANYIWVPVFTYSCLQVHVLKSTDDFGLFYFQQDYTSIILPPTGTFPFHCSWRNIEQKFSSNSRRNYSFTSKLFFNENTKSSWTASVNIKNFTLYTVGFRKLKSSAFISSFKMEIVRLILNLKQKINVTSIHKKEKKLCSPFVPWSG